MSKVSTKATDTANANQNISCGEQSSLSDSAALTPSSFIFPLTPLSSTNVSRRCNNSGRVSAILRLQRVCGNQSTQRYLQRNDDYADAGVPLPGGVPPTPEELEEERLSRTQPGELEDGDVGPALELAERRGDRAHYAQLLEQLRQRDDQGGFGVGVPLALPRGINGSALVTPDVALKILENVTHGQPPFRPELGVGGCSWFITEGTPYAGVGASNSVPVQAELINTSGGLQFDQAALDRIYAAEEARARPEVEAQVRERFRIRTGRDASTTLSNTLAEKVTRQLRGLAERRMWEQVAAEVRASPNQVGEVVLPAGGRFSANPGRFTVIADAAKVRLRNGPMPLLNAIRASGAASPVPALERSAEELARTMRLAGRVRTVMRVGGKILIVVAIAHDLIEIITAEDHVEAIVTSAAGWAGAAAASAGFTALWAPADVAGPWAWAGHGVGVLVSGAIGYWAGSETVRHVYRLTIQSRGQVRASP